MDSQSVKATVKGGCTDMMLPRMSMAARVISLVDTLGLLIAMVVHAASVQDRDGAKLVIEKVSGTSSLVCASSGLMVAMLGSW